MEAQEYDVALSFAGEDREKALELSRALKIRNLRVFYDGDHQGAMLGKDLYTHLITIYNQRALFTVMLVSRHYASKLWTNHERKAMQARAFRENEEYVLPVRLDDTAVPGLLETTGYVSWPPLGSDQIADLIAGKVTERLGKPRVLSRSGIDVFSRSRGIQRMFDRVNPSPMCLVDHDYEVALRWNHYSFIPLTPEERHHLKFFVRMGFIGPRIWVAEMDSLVRGAEVLRYNYETGLTIASSGKIKPVR